MEGGDERPEADSFRSPEREARLLVTRNKPQTSLTTLERSVRASFTQPRYNLIELFCEHEGSWLPQEATGAAAAGVVAT